MKIISCDNCGVVLDADKLPFAPESRMHLDDGSVDLDKFKWEGGDFIAYCPCPVCTTDITQPLP